MSEADDIPPCRTCEKQLPQSAYAKSVRHASGFATRCRTCTSLYVRQRYHTSYRLTQIQHSKNWNAKHRRRK